MSRKATRTTDIGRNFDETWGTSGGTQASNHHRQRLVHGACVEAGNYVCAHPEPSVKQVWKALVLQRAFQQVLDTPGAAEALQHPALKPLLDQAAD